jgi:hypothetical protein
VAGMVFLKRGGVYIISLDSYICNIEGIAKKIASDNKFDVVIPIAERYLLDEYTINTFLQMIEVKKQIITEGERWQSEMHSNISIDALDVDPETKILLTSIYLEVWEKVREIRFLRSLEKYSKEHPIFQCSNLYEHVRNCRELIDLNILSRPKVGTYYEYNDYFLKPSCFLGEEALQYLSDLTCNNAYIRLEPYYCSKQRPPIIVGEAALRPVNPKWIKKLTLFKGQKTGGHYFLPKPIGRKDTRITELEMLKLWEYTVKGIRSLEIHGKRMHSGNLSMMLEEIVEKQICNGYYISKCIHLDSDNEVGSDCKTAILNHIDLAVNVYTTEDFAKRKEQSLANGRVVDASLRSHLLRLDGVPFETLINFALLFFTSEVLTQEWITEQFQ